MQPKTKQIVTGGLLAAISIILVVTVRFPLFLPYLIYEPGDVPILISAFVYGPAVGLLLSVVVAVLMAALTGLGGPFGAFMHFLATGALVVAAGLVYRRWTSPRGLILAGVAGTLVMTILMIFANLLLTPVFYGLPREAVVKALLPGIIPFNLTKAAANSLLAGLVFQAIQVRLGRTSAQTTR